jgi:hypothetical protein
MISKRKFKILLLPNMSMAQVTSQEMVSCPVQGLQRTFHNGDRRTDLKPCANCSFANVDLSLVLIEYGLHG